MTNKKQFYQRYKKIYVLCGAYYKTGGTEVLHQLVYHVNQMGGDADIAYIKIMEGLPLCNPAFEGYVEGHITTIEGVTDIQDCLLIIPEGYPEYHDRYSKIVKMLWWLSVDNFEGIYGFNDVEINKMHEAFRQTISLHLVQSKYAEEYLLKKGVPTSKIRHLADYINDIYLEPVRKPENERADIILYNPRKGKESTDNIIEAGPDLSFKALENMSSEQIRELMLSSKVYIDFGNHPGKDRIPREAAMCGCIVITGRHGSAAYNEDICIPEAYKLDENNVSGAEVADFIRDCVRNYKERIHDFDVYRKVISGEKKEFSEDIRNLFFDFRTEASDYRSISPNNTLIVIVSWNSCHLLMNTVKSIRDTVPAGTYKIAVVDNASTDGAAQWLRNQEDILLIENEENAGFGPACNQAVAATIGTEYESYDVFLLNNDTRLAENSLYFLKKALYEREDTGAVGSISNYAGNRQQVDIEFDSVEQYLSFGREINVPMETPCEERVRLSGFAMLVKRRVWDEIGGFDEDFAPGYFEDDALSMEIAKRGYRLYLVRNSFIYHAGSQSFIKTDYNRVLREHRDLFVHKYGFDIIEYAYPETALLSQLPFDRKDSFNVLQVNCGLGADIKAIRDSFPCARIAGTEEDEKLYDIVRHTETVFFSLNELETSLHGSLIDVLLIAPEYFEALSGDDKKRIAGLCHEKTVILSKNTVYENFPFEKIKLIVWDMDDTFWCGTISEGEVMLPASNVELIKSLTDHGIINSISSKNDAEPVIKELSEAGIWDFFVFNTINWEEKGGAIADKIRTMGLRAENVLFIDDNLRNLEEAKHSSPGLLTADPEIIPYLSEHFAGTAATDTGHKRLAQYKLLEKKTEAQGAGGSSEQFLYDSDIHIVINHNCLEELDRIHELVQRTNQLNYTKHRDNKELLTRLISNDWNESGYIRVWDRFGDYGITGFYCFNKREKVMEHFLFSCRILGMGVEQYVYNKLGCPRFSVKEPVASELKGDKPIPWIKEDVKGAITEDRIINNRVRVLLKGPCDLSAIEPYLSGGNITTEFNYINEYGFVTTGQNHSMHIYESAELSEAEIADIINEVPFIIKGDFETKLFSEEYHIICFSLLQDLSAGLYRNKDNDAYISFSSKNFDLTAPEFRERFIRGEIQGHDFPFTEEIIDSFALKWEFVGNTPLELLLRNLDYIYENVKGDPLILLLLGSETDYEGSNEEFAGLCEVYREINPVIRAFAQDHDRIRIIDPAEFIHSQDDFEDCINHFSRRVYYDIAGRICEYINEAVDRIIEANKAKASKNWQP